MSRPPTKTYIVPVTIAEERRVTVKARTPEEAEDRVRDGRYQKLGPVLARGFLRVGVAEEVDRGA